MNENSVDNIERIPVSEFDDIIQQQSNHTRIHGNRGRGYIGVNERNHRINSIHSHSNGNTMNSHQELHNDHQHPQGHHHANEVNNPTQKQNNPKQNLFKSDQPSGFQVSRSHPMRHHRNQTRHTADRTQRRRYKPHQRNQTFPERGNSSSSRPHGRGQPHRHRHNHTSRVGHSRGRRPQFPPNRLPTPPPRAGVLSSHSSKSGRGTRRVVSSLSIGMVEDNHAGLYKCVAKSRDKSVEQQVQLSVIPRKYPLCITLCAIQFFISS